MPKHKCLYIKTYILSAKVNLFCDKSDIGLKQENSNIIDRNNALDHNRHHINIGIRRAPTSSDVKTRARSIRS